MAFAEPKKILEAFGVTEGMEVADFGAGAGYFATILADMVGEKGKVYAIEIQQELLTKARAFDNTKRENIEFLLGDIEAPNGSQLANNSVDAVVMSNILFQLDDKMLGLTEARRVLKSRGKLLLVDWADSFGGLGPQPEYIMTVDDVKKLCQEAKFEFERPVEAGDHHYGMIFQKP